MLPTYRGGCVRTADMNDILPEFVCDELKKGIRSFNRKINGFSSNTALLTGAETRTSAPLRILRNDEFVSISHQYVYPCGEGAGYAGGIMSSAVDGIRIALAIIQKYKP